MKIRPREVTKIVPLLVDPEPGWMALVNHGANQEPFSSLKSDTGERNTDMSKGKAAKREGVLTRMNFSKDNYKDEAAVQKFLDDNNITDCTIEDEDDVFVAKSTLDPKVELEKAVSTRTKHAGVTAFIAEPKAAGGVPDEDEADEDKSEEATGEKTDATAKSTDKPAAGAAKGASKAKTVDGKAAATKGDEAADEDDKEETDTELRFPANKYDFWGAYMSNEGSLMGVLKDGIDYDGLPPGVDEVVSAIYYSTGNILSSSDDIATKKSKLAQVGEDFAALAGGLYELFEQATTDSTKSANVDRKTKAANYVKSFSESVTRAAKAGDNVIIQPTGTAKGGTTIDIADADDESEEDKLTRLIGKAVKAEVEPLRKELSEQTKKNVALEEQLSRSTARRGDQSIIDNLLPEAEDEDDEEAKAQASIKADRIASMREAMGVRPRGNAN